MKGNNMEPKLYIIMRKDIQDMNPGKAMAQAAHAQADFDAFFENMRWTGAPEGSSLRSFKAVNQWRDNRSFGVTLVLHEPLETISQIVDTIRVSGVTVDPTYPWRNFYGDVFLSNEVTCAWAFVYQEDEFEYMRHFNLHK
jgi:peptidyl-tRNA hydrolase